MTVCRVAFKTLAARYDPEVIDLPSGGARIRLSVIGGRDWDAFVTQHGITFAPAPGRHGPDALLSADEATWNAIAVDVRGGMDAFRHRRLTVRQNLHLGVGFLAATSGMTEPGRLRFHSVQTRRERISVLEAGQGDPILCLHGLGGTKASFLSTVNALADSHRVIAADLPGFGDSDKPIGAAYDAPYFSRAVARLLDALELERAHLVGNSMGGRIAIEVGLREPRARGPHRAAEPRARLAARATQWEWILQLARPRLGLIQPAPRRIVEPLVRRMIPGANDGWAAAGVDEFLRAFLTPPRPRRLLRRRPQHPPRPARGRGRLLDPPRGALARDDVRLGPPRRPRPDRVHEHVERTLPAARHVELDCGHVPQMERPRETHAAIREFLR